MLIERMRENLSAGMGFVEPCLPSSGEKVSDYRKHVEECQALLRGARTPEERQMLLNMAETWEALAVVREKKLAREGKVGDE
jgi:hypothetical protein